MVYNFSLEMCLFKCDGLLLLDLKIDYYFYLLSGFSEALRWQTIPLWSQMYRVHFLTTYHRINGIGMMITHGGWKDLDQFWSARLVFY